MNRDRIQDMLSDYKRDFLLFEWENERYKWEVAKWFQDHWDVNARSFAEMLQTSLKATGNLLDSTSNYPRGMIVDMAKAFPEEVREMFLRLYDETQEVYDRYRTFKESASVLVGKLGKPGDKHYQTEHAISVYLWLRYPDRYSIYKFQEIKRASDALESGYRFKKGFYADNIRLALEFQDEIQQALKSDEEVQELMRKQLTERCYPDPELRTLVSDIIFYASRYYYPKIHHEDINDAVWFPEDYKPGLSADDWSKLLADREVFTVESLEIMLRMKDYGGQATCKQLSVKYGESAEFYRNGSVALAKRVAKKSGCPVMKQSDQQVSKWWPVLYVGKHASKEEAGTFVWKLRKNLADALDRFDLSGVRLYANPVGPDPSESEAELSSPEEATVIQSVSESTTEPEPYTKADFLKEVYLSEQKYDSLVSLLKNKMNIILQGAPGVGKTFAAKRLAYSIMGMKDDSRVEFVQFHQNYSYEDFMMGYRPSDDGFELRYGVFYRFCRKAEEDPSRDYFFIIDEINRGNMSKIFGELLMLIEKQYRGQEITLAYSGESFSVPVNLHIIGMMNTADRSLAMIDYALRRRFSFVSMVPAFDSEGFSAYRKQLENETFDELIAKVGELNRAIAADRSLGNGFCIGHSYFCGQDTCTEEWMRSVVDYDILPMLSEYWFDDPQKLQYWENILHGVFQ